MGSDFVISPEDVVSEGESFAYDLPVKGSNEPKPALYADAQTTTLSSILPAVLDAMYSSPHEWPWGRPCLAMIKYVA
jgi:hypothetical protein